ncbi:MAG: hypothetical protein BWY32_02504 [bacterium ADurb.Bin243]|nr:MAG: hypothetical protein BWY32_02504 [bacterium ADurb.Bin243]
MDSFEALAIEIKKKYLIKDVDKLIKSLSDGNYEVKNDEYFNTLYEIAIHANSKKNYQQSLELFIYLLEKKYKNEEIKVLIKKIYYDPFIDLFKTNYENNITVLKNYPYISNKKFPDSTALNLKFISYNNNYKIFNTKFFLLDENNGSFCKDYLLKNNPENVNAANIEGVIAILNEIYDVNFISLLLEKTYKPSIMWWEKTPLYLYYSDFNVFSEHLQICNFTKILKSERIQFIFGQEELNRYFLNPQSFIPSMLFNSPNIRDDIFGNTIDRIFTIRNNARITAKKEVQAYYKTFDPCCIEEKYKSGQLKIGFFTSRFTTALKYYTRDCIAACQRLNIKTDLLIEQSDLQWGLSEECFCHFLNSFKPDIIFVMDHLRLEYPFIPENIIFVSWIQDYLPTLFSTESAKKIGKFDFIMNLFLSSVDFYKIGYPSDRLIDAPIMSNSEIYKKYELCETELKDYSADICFISNAGNIEEGIAFLNKIFQNTIPEKVKNALNKITSIIYDDVYNEKKHYFDIESLKQIFNIHFQQNGVLISPEQYDQLIANFRVQVLFNIYKTVPIIWLHEKGYNIKLWGKSWVTHPVLKKYAMGVAQNGETLSRILNATKISLGVNMEISLHPRALESILSGCFYLGNYIPPEFDQCDIRRYLAEDEIVFFNSRKDLYGKVDYYLGNEKERKSFVEKGRIKIQKGLTYESLMQTLINRIISSFKPPYAGAFKKKEE